MFSGTRQYAQRLIDMMVVRTARGPEAAQKLDQDEVCINYEVWSIYADRVRAAGTLPTGCAPQDVERARDIQQQVSLSKYVLTCTYIQP